jgi:hypothetical protein
MSQRQLLTGGVQIHDVLPAPSVFAEPSSLAFVNRDDVGAMSQVEAVYTDIVGLNGLYFYSWFAAVTSASQSGAQKLTCKFRANSGSPVTFSNNARCPSGQFWMTTMGLTRAAFSTSTMETLIEQEDATPIGSIQSSGILAMFLSEMGVTDQDNFGIFFDPGVAGNNDVDSTTTGLTLDIKSTEDYLVFWNAVHSPDGITYRNLRFHPRIDGEDISHVRSNSTSGGATRTGRGYSIGMGDAGLTGDVGGNIFTGVSVVPLQKGVRTPSFQASIAEDEAALQKDMNYSMFVIRKAMFEQAKIAKVTTRQQNTSETHLDTDFQVAINSTGKVWIVVSSTYMSAHPNMEVSLHREDAGGGGDVDLIDPIELRGMAGADSGQLLNTDQSCVPLWLSYVDDNPGDVIYTLRLGRGTAGSEVNTINMRDDGLDGVDGYMMALELNLATDT